MNIFGKVRQNMKIEGKVATIIFKNDTNNWTVLLVKKKNEYITCVGETEEIEVDDELEFEGEIVSHKVYGEQFKFSSYKKVSLGNNTGRLNPFLPCPFIRTSNAVSEAIVSHLEVPIPNDIAING